MGIEPRTLTTVDSCFRVDMDWAYCPPIHSGRINLLRFFPSLKSAAKDSIFCPNTFMHAFLIRVTICLVLGYILSPLHTCISSFCLIIQAAVCDTKLRPGLYTFGQSGKHVLLYVDTHGIAAHMYGHIGVSPIRMDVWPLGMGHAPIFLCMS